MKIYPYLFAACLLFSCDNASSVKEPAKTTPESAASEKPVPDTPEEQPAPGLKTELRVLIPTTYREWEDKYPVDHLAKDWIELYHKNGRYYLQQADYKIENGSDACSGSDTKTIIPKKDVLLFMNLTDIALGEIHAAKISKSKIWPKEKTVLKFNGTEYFLRAEGNILSGDETADPEDRFHDVENYKLYISTGTTPETLFLEQESFEDTFIELLFAGDIDRDGKLDFIVSAPRNYEEHRVVLYLSSKAKAGRLVKEAAEIAVQFDC